ncbi:MAG: tRNA(5-methylaminomethyl-2-thiouridylate) methyltransferase [Desulfovibrionaceae bacterium]|nr:tRNA(5-methylaminomethyl-2-thiouridylate) methyltransferase [Desulfovibrionaceae bacterium]
METPQILVLFSGGLDSILAAKILQAQGLKVLGIHATSPFFGQAEALANWEKIYGLPLLALDLSQEMVDLIIKKPEHGYGKRLNPCIDCKILLFKKAKELMHKLGALGLATGEVSGQRPMSQRKDALNIISKAAQVQDILLRPLSAKHLAETSLEAQGLVDRSKLLDISGRGRDQQLKLAKDFKIKKIPSPAGGCHLTEQENVRRYFTILENLEQPQVSDFNLANSGRQFWYFGSSPYWLTIGRNQTDNQKIMHLSKPEDCLLNFPRLPAPLTLARFGSTWPKDLLINAAQLALSYATKALQITNLARLDLQFKDHTEQVIVEAKRDPKWTLPSFEEINNKLKERRKEEAKAKLELLP